MMRRMMLLGVVLALCGATFANAESFGTFTTGTESVVLEYARTAQTGNLAGLDLITVTVASISLDPASGLTQRITGLAALDPPQAGTDGDAWFHALGNGYIVANVVDGMLNVVKTPDAPGSYVNFASEAVGARGTEAGIVLPVGYGPDLVAYTSIWDTWYGTGTGSLAANATLAQLYVPTGGNVELTGSLGLSRSGTGCLGHGSTIPEPGTLALLAGGLVGLIAYAWRKRK